MKVKNKNKQSILFATVLLAGTLLYVFPPHFSSANAACDSTDPTQAKNCSASSSGTSATPTTGEWEWSVNVEEVIGMTIDKPSNYAAGDVDKFLRNEYEVNITSNSGAGFTVGMTTKTDDTALKNKTLSSYTLPTMTASSAVCTSAECTAFPKNAWGYSLDDQSNTGTYRPLKGVSAVPITVMSEKTATSGTQKVYFGAKADTSRASGTYAGTVVFTATSGTSGSDLPVQPGTGDPGASEGPSASPGVQPSVSEAPSASSAAPSMQSSSGRTTYAYSTQGRSYRSTATSEVSEEEDKEKKRSAASDFVSPLGVNEKSSETANIQRGSIITVILAIVATVAAIVGTFFFILAWKGDKDEEGISEV